MIFNVSRLWQELYESEIILSLQPVQLEKAISNPDLIGGKIRQRRKSSGQQLMSWIHQNRHQSQYSSNESVQSTSQQVRPPVRGQTSMMDSCVPFYELYFKENVNIKDNYSIISWEKEF